MSLLKVDDLDEEDLNLFDHYFLKKAEEASEKKAGRPKKQRGSEKEKEEIVS